MFSLPEPEPEKSHVTFFRTAMTSAHTSPGVDLLGEATPTFLNLKPSLTIQIFCASHKKHKHNQSTRPLPHDVHHQQQQQSALPESTAIGSGTGICLSTEHRYYQKEQRVPVVIAEGLLYLENHTSKVRCPPGIISRSN